LKQTKALGKPTDIKQTKPLKVVLLFSAEQLKAAHHYGRKEI
tara:strand:+ start:15593 stop:15718 length:126 start_codon:yes stop_codon:yes gene_type:complete